MPEEKQPDIVNYEDIPTTGPGILIYMASRIKRDANQLINNLRNLFNPVFTQDTNNKMLLENNELLKESESCQESSTLAAPANDIFNAEDEEVLKKSKMNVEKYLALLNEEKQPDVVNYEHIPRARPGLLGYMGGRLNTDDESLLENDTLLKESEHCKESSLLAGPSNDVFGAEFEEALKSAKMHVEEHLALLNAEIQPLDTVNAPIAQKTPYTNAVPTQLDHLSAKEKMEFIRFYLGHVSGLMSNKIQSLKEERNDSAEKKARLLANITKPVSMLLAPNIEHEYYREDALIRAIADIRKSIMDNQAELSNYRSKWGSGFFFGKLLRMDLTKRVTSKTRIDSLTAQLDTIEKRIYSPEVLARMK